jgi:hypothetical protein
MRARPEPDRCRAWEILIGGGAGRKSNPLSSACMARIRDSATTMTGPAEWTNPDLAATMRRALARLLEKQLYKYFSWCCFSV